MKNLFLVVISVFTSINIYGQEYVAIEKDEAIVQEPYFEYEVKSKINSSKKPVYIPLKSFEAIPVYFIKDKSLFNIDTINKKKKSIVINHPDISHVISISASNANCYSFKIYLGMNPAKYKEIDNDKYYYAVPLAVESIDKIKNNRSKINLYLGSTIFYEKTKVKFPASANILDNSDNLNNTNQKSNLQVEDLNLDLLFLQNFSDSTEFISEEDTDKDKEKSSYCILS